MKNDFYDVARRLAQDAVILARLKAEEQMNITPATLSALYPIANKDGSFGIGIEPRAYYLYFQDRGIRPFTMYELEGRTIPIRLPNGTVIFRKAKNVGKPGRIKDRDEKGRIMKGNVGVKWRHPGLPPKNFIEWGIEESIRQNQDNIYQGVINKMIQDKLVEKMRERGY